MAVTSRNSKSTSIKFTNQLERTFFLSSKHAKTTYDSTSRLADFQKQQKVKGYNDGSKKVCKLAKALYGLRESLYTFGKGVESLYFLQYVDDLLICSKSKKRIQSLKKALMKKLKMKNLSKEYLGINVDYDYHKCEM